jgi:hypothetical protein
MVNGYANEATRTEPHDPPHRDARPGDHMTTLAAFGLIIGGAFALLAGAAWLADRDRRRDESDDDRSW